MNHGSDGIREWADALSRAFRDYGIERTSPECVVMIREEIENGVRQHIRNTVEMILERLEDE